MTRAAIRITGTFRNCVLYKCKLLMILLIMGNSILLNLLLYFYYQYHDSALYDSSFLVQRKHYEILDSGFTEQINFNINTICCVNGVLYNWILCVRYHLTESYFNMCDIGLLYKCILEEYLLNILHSVFIY